MRLVITMVAIALVASACGKHKNGGGPADAAKHDAPGTDAPPDGASSSMACMTYCNSIQTTCVGGNAQYDFGSVGTDGSCVGACLDLPAGVAGAASGNSLACRVTHTQLAMTDPDTHCVHAGPSGGDMCGTTCEGFCSIASMACPTQWPAATCAATCATVPSAPPYDRSITTGDTIECRLHYAVLATVDAATNCPETSPTNSTMCQ
jgi:hypothetical protein